MVSIPFIFSIAFETEVSGNQNQVYIYIYIYISTPLFNMTFTATTVWHWPYYYMIMVMVMIMYLTCIYSGVFYSKFVFELCCIIYLKQYKYCRFKSQLPGTVGESRILQLCVKMVEFLLCWLSWRRKSLAWWSIHKIIRLLLMDIPWDVPRKRLHCHRQSYSKT